MSNLKRSILEVVNKLHKTLLKEEGPEGTPVGSELKADPGNAALAARAKQSANQYADQLDGSARIQANGIIMNTLKRGYAGAVDATFLTDLDARWKDGQRASGSSPKFRAYDYIIQTLASIYQTPNGQPIQVGDQSLPMTSGLKKNAYDGLLKMFNLADADNRWFNFIFGSPVPGVATNPKRTPRINTFPDGKKDFAGAKNRVADVNHLLQTGKLLYYMSQPGFYDKGFAYAIDAIRMLYIQLERDKNRGRIEKHGDDDYLKGDDGKLKLSNPRMVGMKNDLKGKTDQNVDLRYVGTKDGGEDPGFHNIERFVNALKVDLKNKSDLDVSNPEVYNMADHLINEVYKFLRRRFNKFPLSKGYPVIADLHKAKMTQNPASLNDIHRDPKWAAIYPEAYAAYSQVPENPNFASVVYNKWFDQYYAEVVAPETERIAKKYVDAMDIDMDVKVRSTMWDKNASKNNVKAEPVAKATSDDYEDPSSRINPKTGKKFQGYDDYYASLEETDGQGGGGKAALLSAVMNVINRLSTPE